MMSKRSSWKIKYKRKLVGVPNATLTGTGSFTIRTEYAPNKNCYTFTDRLQKLQNRAARTISNMSNNVDHSIALRALGWEPLHIIRKKAKARMMYKTLNKLGPESLSSLFTYKNEITNYKLRNISSGLCLPKPRTNSMKKSLGYNGAKLWNSIPNEIRESKSLSCFQKKIAGHNF